MFMCSNCDFMVCYNTVLFLNGVIFVFSRVEPWGGRVIVSDLMWRLLLDAHSYIKNNKLCTLRKIYVDLTSQI